MKAYILFSLLALTACPPAPVPPPQPPDASDAAPGPAPVGDALPPSTPCGRACAALAAAGCAQGAVPDCEGTLFHIEQSRLVRTPSGAALTCDKVAAIRTPADAKALGVACGQ